MAPLPASADRVISSQGRRDQRLLLGVALLVAFLDLLTKWGITWYFQNNQEESTIVLIGSRVFLQLSENDGVAFGLLQNQSVIVGVIVTLGLLAIMVFGWRTAATGGVLVAVAFGLLIGGALGNMLDRLGDGHVTDFVVVGSWPTFNVADSAITVGAILLILWLLLDMRVTPTRVE